MNASHTFWGCVLLACLTAIGCQKSEPNAGLDVREVHPVSGKVTHNGKPAAGAFVGFRATAGAAPYNPRATVGPDGSYRLTTYRQHDGAPPGEYLVTIYWPVDRPKRKDGEDDAGIDLPDRLGGKYSNPETSTLRATVRAGEDNRVDFKLP